MNIPSNSYLNTAELLSPLPAIQKPSPKASDKELMNVSKQFEGIFISQLYKEMRKSTEALTKGGTLFQPSMGENIFKDMLFDQYAQDSAKDSPLGLAKLVYDSLNSKKGAVS